LTIAERIKQRRILLKITQQQLADEAGVNQKQIWRYETGVSIPYADVAAKIAKVLNVSGDWILGLSDDIQPPDNNSLTDAERKLLNIYRSKSPEDAQKLIVIAEAL